MSLTESPIPGPECRKLRYWEGMGFSLRKDVDFEIVLLRKVVHINEKRSQVVLSGIDDQKDFCSL